LTRRNTCGIIVLVTEIVVKGLRQRRIACGLTLEDVAQAAGVRAATVSRWERGVIRPHAIMVRAWIEALDLLERRKRRAGATQPRMGARRP